MSMNVDILFVTYNRPKYAELALSRLLESCPEGARVWVWHNGRNKETLDIVSAYQGHARFFCMYHSKDNKKLRAPTNWLWENTSARFIGKVDDDCLVPDGWIETLVSAHEANPELGAIGCWHFRPEDTTEEMLKSRVFDFNGHRILRNCWIGGSGYLMKRKAQQQLGYLREGQSWPKYVLELSALGWVNGWYYPFLHQDHMDDPRSSYTQLRTDEDVRHFGGLTAQMRGVTTIAELLARQQKGVEEIMTSSLDPRQYVGWRSRLNKWKSRVDLSNSRKAWR